MRLRGFNLLYMLDSSFDKPRDDVDGLLKRLLPDANVVRLVMLHWDDRPTEMSGRGNSNDCSEVRSANGNQFVISIRCLEQFDRILQWTSQQRPLGNHYSFRASIAAGSACQMMDQLTAKRMIRSWFPIQYLYCKAASSVLGHVARRSESLQEFVRMPTQSRDPCVASLPLLIS